MIVENTRTVMPQKIRMTAEQQRRFDEDGFFLVEEALSPAEVEALISVIDEADEKYRRERAVKPHEPFQIRNIVAYHPLFRALIDHPRILPLVVDAIGYNIQIRTSHMDVRPPHLEAAPHHEVGAAGSFFPWHADAPNFGWPTVEGIIPFMEVKVGYYLTDLSEHNSGAICVVRGSHRHSPWIEREGQRVADPERVVEVNVRPGTAMVWRTSLFHAVTPNLSKRTRKVLYYGYCHRWLRPSDYDHQPAEVLADCNPVQRQLLGELGSDSQAYMGPDPVVHPVSRFWRPKDEDIPLKAWAEAQLRPKP
jgi:ectoine hydroxylase-related dioxygenase (phytanoyl-CoA dioxygenase family)